MPDPTQRLFTMNIGDTLDEFVVEEYLGEGESKAARTYKSNNNSAIKLFVAKEAKPLYPLIYEKFRQEAEVLETLKHSPYIMNRVTEFREIGTHNRVSKRAPYYAMELMDGDLHNLILEPDLTLPLTVKLEIISQIVSAAIDFHQAGICHRDLYSSNVLYKTVDGKIICKVADFGSAKDIHRPQTSPYFEPTWNTRYSSPEAASGMLSGDEVSEELMRESDVFALGLMMYEILTGLKQEAIHTNIAGINAMARRENLYDENTSMEAREAFLQNTAIPVMEVGLRQTVDITENDILDTEERAVKLTEIMKNMLEADYTQRLRNLPALKDELDAIRHSIEVNE